MNQVSLRAILSVFQIQSRHSFLFFNLKEGLNKLHFHIDLAIPDNPLKIQSVAHCPLN